MLINLVEVVEPVSTEDGGLGLVGGRLDGAVDLEELGQVDLDVDLLVVVLVDGLDLGEDTGAAGRKRRIRGDRRGHIRRAHLAEYLV